MTSQSRKMPKLTDKPCEEASPTSVRYKGIQTREGRKLLEGSVSIKISVGTGDEARTWHLPKKLLISCSPFFEAALKGGFSEARTDSVKLPEDDPDAFDLFVLWLYVGTLEVDNGNRNKASAYIQVWKLGDKLEIHALQDNPMLQLIQIFDEQCLWAEMFGLMYDGSAPGCKLRHYAIDQILWDRHLGVPYDDTEKYLKLAKVTEDIGLDFMRAGLRGCRLENPADQKTRYLIIPN